MKKSYESPTTELVELDTQVLLHVSGWASTTQNKEEQPGSVELAEESWD